MDEAYPRKVRDEIDISGRRTYPSLEDELEKLNPYLLAAISGVPIVGGSIAQLLSGMGQDIIQERNKKLFEQLADQIEVFGEQTIKKDYFETPEGFDLLIKVLETSSRTRSEKKRTLIARILAGASSADAERGEYSPEEYLNIVADLTDKELAIARTIYILQQNISPTELETNNKLETWERCKESIIEQHDIGANSLPLLLNRIHSGGLLSLFYEVLMGEDPVRPTYWVSPTFKDLMAFLRLET